VLFSAPPRGHSSIWLLLLEAGTGNRVDVEAIQFRFFRVMFGFGMGAALLCRGPPGFRHHFFQYLSRVVVVGSLLTQHQQQATITTITNINNRPPSPPSPAAGTP
jgi:hypothetical protein